MITLYQFSSSPLCEKVRRIMHYKGIEYQINEVDRAKTEDYVSVSPYGKFPAIDDDGSPVCDSTDIAHYFEGKFPEKALVPEDPVLAAQVHVLEDWADESLYFYEITMRLAWEHNARNNIKVFMETMPPTLTEEQALGFLTNAAQNLVSVQGLGRKTREQIVADADRHLAAISNLVGDDGWLVGNSITLADISVISQLKCLLMATEVVEMLDSYPGISAWIDRVDAIAPA